MAGKIRQLGKKQPEGLLMLKGGGGVAIISFSLVSWGNTSDPGKDISFAVDIIIQQISPATLGGRRVRL